MTRRLRGLINAVKDFTVRIAACLALRPVLIAASDRDDRDLSDGVDGDRPRLFLAIVDNTSGIIF